LIGEKSPAALFSDISCVFGGKKRGFSPGPRRDLPIRVATPEQAQARRADIKPGRSR
jgi:hypothetical protein